MSKRIVIGLCMIVASVFILYTPGIFSNDYSIATLNGLLNSPWGQIGQALNPDIAQQAQMAMIVVDILYMGIVFGGALIAWAILGGNREEEVLSND